MCNRDMLYTFSHACVDKARDSSKSATELWPHKILLSSSSLIPVDILHSAFPWWVSPGSQLGIGMGNHICTTHTTHAMVTQYGTMAFS